jgi:hypothetical protein
MRKEGLAESFGKTDSTMGTYYRPIRFGRFGGYIKFDAKYWCSKRHTPLWLELREVQEGRFTNSTSELRSALAALLTGPRVRAFDDNYQMLIPLELPLGVERPAVMEHLLRQVRVVVDVLTRNISNDL